MVMTKMMVVMLYCWWWYPVHHTVTGAPSDRKCNWPRYCVLFYRSLHLHNRNWQVSWSVFGYVVLLVSRWLNWAIICSGNGLFDVKQLLKQIKTHREFWPFWMKSAFRFLLWLSIYVLYIVCSQQELSKYHVPYKTTCYNSSYVTRMYM